MNRELVFYIKLFREFGVHVALFLILVGLIFKVFIPQAQTVLANRTLTNEGNQHLISLQAKTQILKTTNRIEIRNRLQKLNLALPLEKDVGLMFSSLDNIAALSNTRLGTFSLKVGSFATSSAIPATSSVGVPALEVKLNVSGTTGNIAEFIKQAHKTIPLMQISSVSLGGLSSTVQLLYYYKPAATINQAIDTPLPAISTARDKILREIEQREGPVIFNSEIPVTVKTSRPDPFH